MVQIMPHFLRVISYGLCNYATFHWCAKLQHRIILKAGNGVFLGVAETIVSSLLCCGVGIVQCLFNVLYYVIGVRNTKKPPGNRISFS